MAFVVDVDTSILGDVPKRGRAAKPKTAPEPVFSMAKEKTIKGIKASIEEAKQRFLGMRGGATPKAQGKAEKRKSYYASYAWRVDFRNKENPGKDERAKVSLKAGAAKLSIFPKMTTNNGAWVAVPGQSVDYLAMPGKNVAAYLENTLLPMVEAMDKDDGGLGKLFHETVLERSKKARMKSIKAGTIKYNEETDCFE